MKLEQVILDTVLPIGEMLRKNAFDYGELNWKVGEDPVTEMDKKAERKICDIILKYMPANFVGEEFGVVDNGADITWYIDPIDGTKSFVRRDYLSTISIAAEKEGDLVAGCVYDFMRDIMYLGINGDSCILHNGEKYEMSKGRVFSKLQVAVEERGYNNIIEINGLENVSAWKCGGSIALSMAHMAGGNFDVLVCPPRENSNSYDIAAGYYLMKSVGFQITDYNGGRFNYKDPVDGLIAIGNNVTREEIEKLGFD